MRVLAACMLAGLVLLQVSPPARATDAYPTTDDQATSLGVARWFYWGQTGNQVGALAIQNHARLAQVRVEDPAVPTFAVSLVGNTGAYASGWWWYFGVDAGTPAGLRFAVVMVRNVGVQNRAWWWYFGVDSGTVGNLLAQNNARLIALRRRSGSRQGTPARSRSRGSRLPTRCSPRTTAGVRSQR